MFKNVNVSKDSKTVLCLYATLGFRSFLYFFLDIILNDSD